MSYTLDNLRASHQEVLDILRCLSECFPSTCVSCRGVWIWQSQWLSTSEHNLACQAILRIFVLEASPEELEMKQDSICGQFKKLDALDWDLSRAFFSAAARIIFPKMSDAARKRMRDLSLRDLSLRDLSLRDLSLRDLSYEPELQEYKVPTRWTSQSSQDGRAFASLFRTKNYFKPGSFNIPEEFVFMILSFLPPINLRIIGRASSYFLVRSVQQRYHEEYFLENTAFRYAHAAMLETGLIQKCRLRVDVSHPLNICGAALPGLTGQRTLRRPSTDFAALHQSFCSKPTIKTRSSCDNRC